jgi:hypothetical protein
LPADFLLAGKEIVVKRIGPAELRVSHFEPGKEDQILVCTTQLDDVLRTVARVGGHYENLLELVHEAKRQGQLNGRVVVDALPDSNRLAEKHYEEQAASAAARRRVANPLPEMFANRLGRDDGQDDSAANLTSAAEELEQDAAREEASKKKSLWSKMMWWQD